MKLRLAILPILTCPLFSMALLLLACPLFSRAQALVIDSTRFITGLRPGTHIEFAIPTADKGILFVGEESGNPGGIIPYFPIDTSYNGNVLIGKIDSNQQISWIKVYGGSNDDNAGSACQTPDGGYAVLGTTLSNDGDVTGYHGDADLWLLRIDALGNLLWEGCFGSAEADGGMSIANTTDHGFILLGQTNGYDGDVPFHYGNGLTYDWLVVKTDSMGNKQWSKDLGGTNDEAYGTVLAVDSSYYLVGTSNSNDHDCTDSLWHPGVNMSYGNYYVLKLDDTGKVLWDSSYGGSGGDAANYAMFDVRDSTIVINGLTYSDDYMVSGFHECYGSDDMWLIKINKNGTLIWEKSLGSTQDEAGTSVCPSGNGGYIAYGSTQPQQCRVDSIGDIGSEDCWMFAIDSNGFILNSKIFGGIRYEFPASILPYLNGYVATGGSSSYLLTEGTTYGNFDSVGGGFISYIDYWPLTVKNINDYSETIAVYPNPADGNVKVIVSGNAPGNLAIFNSMGQIIYNEEIKNQATYIDINVEGWVSGLYILKWQSEEGNVQTTKFIKY